MIKLLYITNGINGSGGLERVLSIKASYLADKLDYEVHILTLHGGDENPFFNFSKKIVFHDIKVMGRKPIGYFLSYRKGIKSILKILNPDIVSVCDDGLKGVLFPLIFKIVFKVVYERHVSQQIEIKTENPSIFYKIVNNFKFKLMNFSGKKFDKFIVLTKGNVKEWPLDNLMVISNPLPFESNYQSKLSTKTALVVGKQSFQKGYDRLLDIWKIVSKIHPDWKLEVYGKLDPTLGLEKKMQSLGVSETVDFHPPVKNIGKRYKKASLYLMTSRYEGFGMVLIEAMNFGVPCISFDCPYGPSDIISNQKDGYIIQNGDVQAFANAVIELIEKVDLRKLMGNNAVKNVKKYNVNIVAKQWDDLFKEMVRT